MPALPLSNQQLAEAAQLKSLFQNWQRVQRDSGRPSSQEAAAEQLGFGQSALAQYLNGRIPLNVESALKFAKLLNGHIADFSPSLAAQAGKLAEQLAKEEGLSVEHFAPAPGQSVGDNVIVLSADEHQELLRAQQARSLQWIDFDEQELLTFFRGTDDKSRKMMLIHARSMPRVVDVRVVGDKS